MRTTLDLPDELLKRAKITAVERGTTLRELVRHALEQELGQSPRTARHREKLPLVEVSADCPLLRMTPDELKQIEAEEDAEKLICETS